MKDKLTSADPAGWYLYRYGDTEQWAPLRWNGMELRTLGNEMLPAGMAAKCSNFRRLVEAEPEVIEGDGVTVLPKGIYWIKPRGCIAFVHSYPDDHRTDGSSQYIRIPDPHFPPRKPAIPPKPELVLVWWTEDSQPVWAFDKGDEIEWSGAGRVKKAACWKVERQA